MSPGASEKGELGNYRSKMNGKLWCELTEEEHRQLPGDYEAQPGQGEITFHSEEHLATSDKGVAFLRRFMEQQLKQVAEGGDPAGAPSVSRTPTCGSRPGRN